MPIASGIVYGQTLADSVLSGGAGSVAGAFTFTSPSTAPTAGVHSAALTFTPTDLANYETIAAGNVDVLVIGPPEFLSGSGININSSMSYAIFKFIAIEGVQYRIVYTDDLLITNEWTASLPPFPDGWTNGVGEIMLQDNTILGVTQRFYRIEAR
jgi:hypothetical protein